MKFYLNTRVRMEVRERIKNVLTKKFMKTFEDIDLEDYNLGDYTKKELSIVLARNLDIGVNNYLLKCKETNFNEIMYKSRMRQIIFNLFPNKSVNNKTLLPRVLKKDITIQYLCESMTAEEMFPDHYIQVRQEMEIEMEKKYGMTDISKLPDGAVKCRKCHSWKTSYVELMTRSADEPTSKFAFCHKCHFRWRFE